MALQMSLDALGVKTPTGYYRIRSFRWQRPGSITYELAGYTSRETAEANDLMPLALVEFSFVADVGSEDPRALIYADVRRRITLGAANPPPGADATAAEVAAYGRKARSDGFYLFIDGQITDV